MAQKATEDQNSNNADQYDNLVKDNSEDVISAFLKGVKVGDHHSVWTEKNVDRSNSIFGPRSECKSIFPMKIHSLELRAGSNLLFIKHDSKSQDEDLMNQLLKFCQNESKF